MHGRITKQNNDNDCMILLSVLSRSMSQREPMSQWGLTPVTHAKNRRR